VVDLISTGETQFFRDQFPFDLLKVKLLPEMIARKRELSPQGKLSIRIWSAACASGQEVYSIAMVLKEVLPDIHKHDVSILGTDISDLALARAAGGVYNAIEVERGLSKKRLEHHFVHSAGAWTVSPELRSLATFKKLNLLEDFSRQGTFDLVFCRNVAIYFSESDRQGLFTRMGKALNANGVLIVGSTELVTLASSQFVSKTHDRAVYYQNK
jgi:chemotaxis protein methyltransferase CheR